jgi:hypothetical protein
MADKFQREIPLDDAALFALVEQKGQLVEGGRQLATDMEALSKQHEKLMEAMTEQTTKVNDLKRQIIKRVREIADTQLGEFELPVTTEIKDGKVILLATDGLEEFKDSFRGFDKWRQALPRKKKLEDSNTNV